MRDNKPGGGGVLYLSYDGMLEPLGQSQVLAYLERLACKRPIHLISFEKPRDWCDVAKQESVSRRIEAAGIAWHPLRYHRWPTAPATAWDIARGTSLGAALVRRHALSVVHARSYVPAAMALAVKRLTGARFLFDMRGLWADERVDGGIWPKDGYLYRMAKRVERRLFRGADAVVSLTQAGKREIEGFGYLSGRGPPFTVIPTCADLEKFRPPASRPDGFTVGYLGTVGNWYDFDKVAQLFVLLRGIRPDARVLVINRGEHAAVRGALLAAGLPESHFEIRAADYCDVPSQIRRLNAAILVARPSYSQIARSPTKLAELLGCGVPCLINSGVGDTEAIISEGRAGVVMKGFSDAACEAAARELVALARDPDISKRCAATAKRHFAIENGVDAYARLYTEVST